MNDDDIGKWLTSLGIEKRQIIPTNVLCQQRHQPELNQFRNEINIFPLEWFDGGDGHDFEFFMGCREGLAFLPLHQSTSVEINPADFKWRKVTVEKYNETANKWRIKELKSAAIYEVPRIYLMFIVEKPFKFAQRIQRAQQLRVECVMRLKFEAVVDKIVLSEILKPPQRLRDNIGKLLFHSSNMRWKEFFEWEYSLQYQKTLAALDLIKFLATNPHESIQLLPTMATRKAKLENLAGNNGVEMKKIFEKSRRDFQRMWLYSCPQAIKIMEFINNECDEVTRTSLFHIQTTNSEDLNCFVNANNEKLSEISSFLLHKWIEDVLVRAVNYHLAEAGKGHLDLTVNDWNIYRQSKLHRLIGLIKQRMQIALRLMLRSSLRAFVNHLCHPCESMLNIAVDFVWGNDLVTSRFQSNTQPVFTLILDFDEDANQPVFTTDIERFQIEIVKIFKSRILTTHEVPQIEPYLVSLTFEKGLKLSSIGLLDEEIQNQIRHLQRCYQAALIPLRAFAQEFRKFSELKNLIIPEYIRSCGESDKTAKEMKEEISHQLECIDEIERSVPSKIVIGPFQISVEAMKKSLIVKRRELYESLLEMFVDRLRAKLVATNDEYKDIFHKLTQKCENVEKIVEIREWIPKIDDEIEQIKSKMEDVEVDIEVLGTMLITLSDEDIEVKFSSLKMPEKIAKKVIEIQPKHHFEFEQFRKLQAANEAQFHQKIEALAEDVEGCAMKHEFEDLSKTSSECDKLWSALNEMVTHGEMLNNRQQIFNQPEIDTERLTVLVKRLHPYHTLWTMASNFLHSKENWMTSPLSNVDIEIVDSEMKRCENVLRDSRLHFAADAEMTVLIEKISNVVDAGSKLFDVLRDLKNPDFQDKHWSILSEKTGMRYKNKPTITFDSLVARGIVINAEVVKAVLIEATSEREAKEFEEIEAEKKRREDEEIKKKKKARLVARKDI